jgi:hypothetical protein
LSGAGFGDVELSRGLETLFEASWSFLPRSRERPKREPAKTHPWITAKIVIRPPKTEDFGSEGGETTCLTASGARRIPQNPEPITSSINTMMIAPRTNSRMMPRIVTTVAGPLMSPSSLVEITLPGGGRPWAPHAPRGFSPAPNPDSNRHTLRKSDPFDFLTVG